MRTRIATLGERPVRYLEAGSGRPVVWLHAFPLSADQWLPQLARVPDGWHMIAPDLRGFRGSGPGQTLGATPGSQDLDGLTVDDYAADVLALMTHLRIETAVIGGLSMGGYVAFALYRQAPERVAGLVLANTRATADSAEGQAARDRHIDLVMRQGVAGLARDMLPKLLGATTQRERPDLVELVGRTIAMNSPEAVIAALRALKQRPDSTPLLSSIRCPTTVITGEEDVLIPPVESATMQRAIAGSRLVVVPRAGHLSNLEGDGSVFHSFAL